VVVCANTEPKLGRAHETQYITSNGVAWDGRSDADRNDLADALASYLFLERRWQLEVLRHRRSRKGVLILAAR